jgi:hypothetical protein
VIRPRVGFSDRNRGATARFAGPRRPGQELEKCSMRKVRCGGPPAPGRSADPRFRNGPCASEHPPAPSAPV